MRKLISVLLLFFLLSIPSLAQQKPPDPEGHTWWQHAVSYEVYPRSFADGNGDGIGDLNGITSRLNCLHDLGVDAIWITPRLPSPQIDFGYDVSNYEAIDPMYGTLADFDRLVAEIVNHTSDQHKWFMDSKSSRTSAHRDWYVPCSGRPAPTPASPAASRGFRFRLPRKRTTWDQSARIPTRS